MSITPSTMKCPVCPDQMLETLDAAIGTFERCPNCSGLFIQQELIAAASQDRSQCVTALAETKTLLLPTEKWCPKCLQKLFDGRVRSRGVIFTLCPTCDRLWTALSTLRQFEEAVERTLRLQIDLAASASPDRPASANRFSSSPLNTPSLGSVNDSGIGHLFRAFARFFDRWADGLNGRKPRGAPSNPMKATKPVLMEKPAKKPLILAVEPAFPTVLPETVSESPIVEIPRFVFPEEPIVEEKAVPVEGIAEPRPESKPELKPEPAPEPKPEFVEFPDLPILYVEPMPEPVAPPIPEPVAEPIAEPFVERADIPTRDAEMDEMRRLMTEGPSFLSKPKGREEVNKGKLAVPVPKPVFRKPDLPKPAEKKAPVQPAGERSGFFGKLKSAWSPAPAKALKPVKPSEPKIRPFSIPEPTPPPLPTPARAMELPQPKPAPKPITKPAVVPKAPITEPLKLAKSSEPGVFAKLFAPKKSVKKVVASDPAKAPSPAAAPEPVIATPVVPIAKKRSAGPKPKPKREKGPRDPIDHLVFWPPWVLGILAVVGSSFRDFGFEAGPAILWGLAGWAIGWMVRLGRLYPFKAFKETTVRELLEANEDKKAGGQPVLLHGQIVPANESEPKGEVLFQQEALTLRLNRLGRWDVIPRLFGLSNPRQLLKGEVTLRGWYRSGQVPSVEIHDLRADKAVRKSLVRSLRWTSAVALLVLALVISLSLE